MTTPVYVATVALPAAFSLLPAPMRSPAAARLLLAIGYQESGYQARRQYYGGPARGWWQFEMGGVEGVLEHHASRDVARAVCGTLGYDPEDARGVHLGLEHNDVLAACMARLLLWTDPRALPEAAHQAPQGWLIYLATWRPGKPRTEKWSASYALGWTVMPGDTVRA